MRFRTASAIWLGIVLALWLATDSSTAKGPEGMLGSRASMPAIVGNEQPMTDHRPPQPWGWVGMTGRCPGGAR